jgi:glycosyltransferase involved in cell wall biosynthesis
MRELIKSLKIEKLIIITSNEVAERLKEIITHEKIVIKIVDRKKVYVNLMLAIWYAFYTAIIYFESLTTANKFFNVVKHTIAKLNPYHKIIASNEIDIFHVPVQYSPIYKTKIPVVITMHDLQEYHFPQNFSFKERLSRKIKNKMGILDSDHIIVSFKHVKNDIINFFKIDGEKVSVCPPPFAENWFVDEKETEWTDTSKKYNLKGKYLLYPAATWKHKNHIKLLEAFKRIRDDGLDYNLVCTGNKTEYYNNVIKKNIEKLEISGAVHFLGIVPEEDLISLYRNTSLVVIPTLYEAGSGPLYEAMRYKVPVICSNVTSLPDTIENKEFLFEPADANELFNKIKKGLIDEGFRKRNIDNSTNRMAKLNLVDTSLNFINTYNKVID